jgi:hypothetical protein
MIRKTRLNLSIVFVSLIWSPIIPIYLIPLEDIKWINWFNPSGIFTLQYPSLDFWKIIDVENQNNIKLLYNLEDIDNNIDNNGNGYDIIILHIDNNFTSVIISFKIIFVN